MSTMRWALPVALLLVAAHGFPSIAGDQMPSADARDKAQIEKRRTECLAQPELRLGMTPSEAMSSRWGKPYDGNITMTATGRHEQWIYKDFVSADGCDRIYGSERLRFLYFENGRLVAIQR